MRPFVDWPSYSHVYPIYLQFKSMESPEGRRDGRTRLDPLHPSLLCRRSSWRFRNPTSSLSWLLSITCLLQHWQEGSLALLARKIRPICIVTLPGLSSASPLLVDIIEECLVILSQEKDTLSILERISE